MFSDLVQLNMSTNVVLFGIFPLIIIGLGIAYAVKQWRDRQRQREVERRQSDAGATPPPR